MPLCGVVEILATHSDVDTLRRIVQDLMVGVKGHSLRRMARGSNIMTQTLNKYAFKML